MADALNGGIYRTSITNKGFKHERTSDHEFYAFYYLGKKTIIKTKISCGKDDATFGPELLKSCARQCRLTLPQFKQYGKCTMNQTDYENILLAQGIIP